MVATVLPSLGGIQHGDLELPRARLMDGLIDPGASSKMAYLKRGLTDRMLVGNEALDAYLRFPMSTGFSGRLFTRTAN